LRKRKRRSVPIRAIPATSSATAISLRATSSPAASQRPSTGPSGRSAASPTASKANTVEATTHALAGDLDLARDIGRDCLRRFADVAVARLSDAYMLRDAAALARLQQGLRLAGIPG
jgi:hypothetical protein